MYIGTYVDYSQQKLLVFRKNQGAEIHNRISLDFGILCT